VNWRQTCYLLAMASNPPTPDEVVSTMFSRDAASAGLGMEVVEARPGYAKVTMPVTAKHVNGLDVCHGGFIFSLADSAMAFASNADNQQSVAVHADIYWHAPGRLHTTLTAEAHRRQQQGRNSLHDVRVTDNEGVLVASFRGQTRDVGGAYLP